jgi:hypothetical protein
VFAILRGLVESSCHSKHDIEPEYAIPNVSVIVNGFVKELFPFFESLTWGALMNRLILGIHVRLVKVSILPWTLRTN